MGGVSGFSNSNAKHVRGVKKHVDNSKVSELTISKVQASRTNAGNINVVKNDIVANAKNAIGIKTLAVF